MREKRLWISTAACFSGLTERERQSPLQAFTQRPQATHFKLKSDLGSAPGGRATASREGLPGRETAAKPPSVVFSAVSTAASTAMPLRVSRRVNFSPLEVSFSGDALGKHARHFEQPGPTLWRRSAKEERSEKSVPTGHTQLHQKRPWPNVARISTAAKITSPGTNNDNAFA